MEQFIQNSGALISEYAVTIVLKLLFAGLILVVGRFIVKGLVNFFTRSRLAKNMNEAAVGFVKSALGFVLNIVLLLTVAAVLGVPMTSIIALLSSAGLAIGLALQGGLSNFAGGVILIVFRPFDVGDYIVVGGDEGTVSKINIFYTTLITPDNRRVVIPNGNVTGNSVTNVSSEGTRRLDIEINVTPDTDIDLLLDVLKSRVAVDSRVISKAPPFAAVTGYGAGCLVVALRVWCTTGDYWPLKFDLNKKIPAVLAEYDSITIAKPVIEISKKA